MKNSRLNSTNKYYDSAGNAYTEAQIRQRYNQEKYGFMPKYICECCGESQAFDPDHTISKARCKILHKVELIWLESNISWSCRKCHLEWESYKDGKFSHHNNAYERMLFTFIYDREGFTKRYYCITNLGLQELLMNKLTSKNACY